MTIKERLDLFRSNVGSEWVEVSSKVAPYQCMDLAYLWVFVLNYPKETIRNALAYQVYTNPKPITKEYFELIKNTPEFVPIAGDLVVWDKKFNGTAGHIAIAIGEGDTKKFKSYDQNIGTDYPQVIEHNYNHVLGVLRPKKNLYLVESDMNLIDLKTDIPTWAENELGLKAYDNYDNKWSFVDLVKDWAKSHEDVAVLSKQILEEQEAYTKIEEIAKGHQSANSKLNAENDELKKEIESLKAESSKPNTFEQFIKYLISLIKKEVKEDPNDTSGKNS